MIVVQCAKFCNDWIIVVIVDQPVLTPDGKVHGANKGPTWVLSAPDGPHVGPMNLAIRDAFWTQDAFRRDILYL